MNQYVIKNKKPGTEKDKNLKKQAATSVFHLFD